MISLGIDIGSTTTKLVLTDGGEVIYENYRRHLSRVRETTLEMLREMQAQFPLGEVRVTLTGSAGMGVAESANLPFIQEVFATGVVVSKLAPDTGVVIELGGEDAKVIFINGNNLDERMNGTCAGGTGAFIDQMAVLLNMTVDEMDEESLKATEVSPIASRCGVFAKSDIQPLLNQGTAKANIAAGIYQAVVNQTIAGLIQGQTISGKVMFLGGPLYYCKGLRLRFRETLGLDDSNSVFPEYARFAVALGAAIHASDCEPIQFSELLERIENCTGSENGYAALAPLFTDENDYSEFLKRHARATVPPRDISKYQGKAWLGIDCGSTTTKLVLIAEDRSILYTYYASNRGDPVSTVHRELINIRKLCGDHVTVCGSAVTGYGEDLIRHAFRVDAGIVETIAHYTAAKHFLPEVDFIIDIGGQDIKCFKIRNGVIDSIMLNEACSSGCGSFIEAFAESMGYSIKDFSELAIYANAPVNLGSRCTVFMNSSVKQAQKDGASVPNISAGLSISVVKNALYKVIRASSPDELGKNIVVQGGTFSNDAVLRAFENEIGANVIRPQIAGLMGAFGAAIRAMSHTTSTLLSAAELESFTHTSAPATCHGCTNNCHLTVNCFSDGSRHISGNQCQRGLGLKNESELPNVFAFKRRYLENLKPKSGARGKLGIPLALSAYELAPLWHELFSSLGFEVHFSRPSTRRTYERGQFTIPSDTACYPAKIMHGHVLELIDEGFEIIFSPELTYNIDEGASDNHYNCPIVAYYPELLAGNIDALKSVSFIHPHLCIDSAFSLAKTIYRPLHTLDGSISFLAVLFACKKAFAAYRKYTDAVRREGERAIAFARKNGLRIMILAGRPYHIDPQICHGIDKLANSLGFVVVSEDSVCSLEPVKYVNVLDQWTFHARLYRAAGYAARHADTELVQLVSFGCGVDAITTDEIREILEDSGKFYTQLKIDEIINLGAVRIRLRSLLGALEEANEK